MTVGFKFDFKLEEWKTDSNVSTQQLLGLLEIGTDEESENRFDI